MTNQPCVQISIYKHGPNQANIVLDATKCDGAPPFIFNTFIQYGTSKEEVVFVKQLDSVIEVITVNFKTHLLKTYRVSVTQPIGDYLKDVINFH